MTRIFSDRHLEPETGIFTLTDSAAHHLTNVLRAAPGDEFEIADADGTVYRASLRGDLTADILGKATASTTAEARDVVLYQAVPKGKRMEVVIEKATELGVSRIVPIVTDRSVVRPGEGNKLERWRRIAESAARQSLGEKMPEMSAPVAFREALREASGAVLLHIGADLPYLEDEVGSEGVGLFVGPEGGWSEGELEFASESGVPLAQMGSRRLRSETAGIAAVVRARAAMELKMRDSNRPGGRI